MARRLRAAYTAGSDSIAVSAEGGLSDERRRLARRTLSGFVGLEVDRTAEDRLAARSLLDAGEVSLQQTLAQLRGTVTSMHRDAAEAVATGDGSLASTVRRRSAEVDRLASLVARQFTGALVDVAEVERLQTDRTTAYRHERTARRLRRVGTDAARIAALGERLADRPPAEVGEALRESATALTAVLGAALDVESAPPAAREDLDATLSALAAAVGAGDGQDLLVYGRLLERYRESVAAADAIAEATTQARLLADGRE